MYSKCENPIQIWKAEGDMICELFGPGVNYVRGSHPLTVFAAVLWLQPLWPFGGTTLALYIIKLHFENRIK